MVNRNSKVTVNQNYSLFVELRGVAKSGDHSPYVTSFTLHIVTWAIVNIGILIGAVLNVMFSNLDDFPYIHEFPNNTVHVCEAGLNPFQLMKELFGEQDSESKSNFNLTYWIGQNCSLHTVIA